jgi:hypothetical protein
MPSTSHKPGAPFLAHFARSGIPQPSTVPATARVERTLLSVAFDLDCDFGEERAPAAPFLAYFARSGIPQLSTPWDFDPAEDRAASTTVEERRFSAA